MRIRINFMGVLSLQEVFPETTIQEICREFEDKPNEILRVFWGSEILTKKRDLTLKDIGIEDDDLITIKRPIQKKGLHSFVIFSECEKTGIIDDEAIQDQSISNEVQKISEIILPIVKENDLKLLPIRTPESLEKSPLVDHVELGIEGNILDFDTQSFKEKLAKEFKIPIHDVIILSVQSGSIWVILLLDLIF